MSATSLLTQVISALAETSVPHMLVGSFASMSHGAPRATQNIDIVIDPTPESLRQFLAAVSSDDLYVSPMAEDALARRDQFNIIDPSTGWKVDLIIRKDRPFSRSEFARRSPARVLDVDVYLASAEDTVLAKLEWAAMSGSDRQVADASGVLAVGADALDDGYLDRWAAELGVTDLLARARQGWAHHLTGPPPASAWSVIAGPPEEDVGDVAVPAAVHAVADGRTIRPIWVNVVGGVTFEVGARGERDRCFVKWAPANSRLDLAGEAERMTWARAYTPVPTVLGSGADDDGTWLATTPLPGDSAVSERWRHHPATAVAAIGGGLRALHDALPIADCPFSWTPTVRLDQAVGHDDGRDPVSTLDDDADAHAHAHTTVPVSWHDAAHQGLTVGEAHRILADPPPVDRLVVCHGDACAPNTLIRDDGRWSGHVDLGALGVADRWADLAIATWSTQWNYGPGWEGALLDAYGIAPDPRRTAWYRLLWDMT